MKNYNLKQLQVFIKVAEAGSFTTAAAQLFLSQSTVSSHVMALESELGVQLIDRQAKKRIRLTAEGVRLLPFARDIIERCRDIEDNISVYAKEELVIGASTVPAQHLVPDYLAAYLREQPDANIYIKTGDSEEIIQMVLDNEVQIGFVGTHSARQALNWILIKEDHLVVITANDEAHQGMLQDGALGKDLLREPLILREQGSGTQAVVDFYLNRSDHPEKPPVVRASDPQSIIELVVRGAGISILSALSVAEPVASGKLLQFELEEEPVLRKFYMVHRRNARLTERAEQLIRLVESFL